MRLIYTGPPTGVAKLARALRDEGVTVQYAPPFETVTSRDTVANVVLR